MLKVMNVSSWRLVNHVLRCMVEALALRHYWAMA